MSVISMSPYASWTLILMLIVLCATLGWIFAQIDAPSAAAQEEDPGSTATEGPAPNAHGSTVYDWAEDEGFLVDHPLD